MSLYHSINFNKVLIRRSSAVTKLIKRVTHYGCMTQVVGGYHAACLLSDWDRVAFAAAHAIMACTMGLE